MRFHFGESMTPIENYIPLAKAAEAAGYAGMTVPDSLIYPQSSSTKYSYTDDGGREFLENKPFLESFIHVTAMLGATEKLEVTTNVVKLPVRPPLYVAKIVASIEALYDNRFNFGVGLSVWPEDYQVMGVPWEGRGKRFDECIDIVRGLTNGGYFEYHGEFFDLPPVKINPVPSKPVPILIGGHSDAALKRAARNDGWMYAGGGLEAMLPMLDKLAAYRAELGRDHPSYRIFASAFGDMDLDMVRRHEDAGVTDIVVAFRNLYAVEEDSQPLEEKIADLSRFADDVIARY
jgi:alkanesulfonate monooxygenase SsuD/methylene tetrahydromethanopterin reductase-like flavin-dependent oxidoreductase (luciferase family)